MGAERRRAVGCRGRVAEHGVAVARGLRVMGQPGRVRRALRRVGQRREGGPVQRKSPIGRKGLLDRPPSELVAEGDSLPLAGQHPRGQALLEAVDGIGRQCLQQPELDQWRRDRRRLHQRPRPRAQPGETGEDGVLHGARQVVLLGGQRLGDVEGVAARLGV